MKNKNHFIISPDLIYSASVFCKCFCARLAYILASSFFPIILLYSAIAHAARPGSSSPYARAITQYVNGAGSINIARLHNSIARAVSPVFFFCDR